MQSMSFLMHSILLFVQQMYICFTKIRHFSKKAHKTLKKTAHNYLRIKIYTYICSRREDKDLYLMCFSQQNATKNNRIAFFFVILLD